MMWWFRIKLKQLLCSLRGHGGVTVRQYEQELGDCTEYGTVLTCKKCGREDWIHERTGWHIP